MMSGNELSGQVAIITGATRKRGLGRAIALCLAQAGADVAVTGASAKGSLTEDERQEGWLGLASVVDEIRALGRRALGVVVDVSDAAAVRRMVDEVVAGLGGIDILVNNAGTIRRNDALDFSEDDWDAVMGVNLKTSFFLSQAVARRWVAAQRGGKILNIV